MHPLALVCLLAVWTAGPPDPPLSDLERFEPDAAEWVGFSWQLERRVDALIVIQPWRAALLFEVETEICRCRQPWDLLADAQRPQWACWWDGDRRDSDAIRRDYLRRLRVLIGEQAYAEGRMPEPVPLALFNRIE